jgi:hypothetical protein
MFRIVEFLFLYNFLFFLMDLSESGNRNGSFFHYKSKIDKKVPFNRTLI